MIKPARCQPHGSVLPTQFAKLRRPLPPHHHSSLASSANMHILLSNSTAAGMPVNAANPAIALRGAILRTNTPMSSIFGGAVEARPCRVDLYACVRAPPPGYLNTNFPYMQN